MSCYRTLAMGAALLSLGSCSSIVQGTDQTVIVNTNPPAATCSFEREGQEIGAVLSTPGSVTVSRTKHNITITCEKEDYLPATYINDSGWESGSGAAGIALDVILTLGISSAIDSATGADNRYESPVNISMVPVVESNSRLEDGASPTDTPSDGEWSAQDGAWQLSLTLQDGNFTGRATQGEADPQEVTGQIQEGNLLNGSIARKDDPSWGSLSGFFPRILLIRNGEIEASFELEKGTSTGS